MNAPLLIPKNSASPVEIREAILRLEQLMLSLPPAENGEIGTIEIQTLHHFSPGVYMREIFIPKGTLLTGKIHKEEHLNILSQGKIGVLTDDGAKLLHASQVIPSKPGIKRVGYTLEDTVWITVHPNPLEERDTDKLEERLVFQVGLEPPEWVEKLQIDGGDLCHS